MARKQATTEPAATDIKITQSTIEGLAERYVSVQNTLDKLDGTKKWEWARDVSLMLACTADKSARTTASERLGEMIGIGLGRAAYSGSWIRQHCSAYKKFEGGLNNQDDYRGFLAAVNGNAGPSKQASAKQSDSSTDRSETDSDGEIETDYLGKITSAVKRAIAAGISLAEIQQAVLAGQE